MTNYLKIEWDGFKHKMKSRQYQKKIVFQIIEGIVFTGLLFGYFIYGFIPIGKALDIYEKSKNYDPIIGVSTALFMILSLWFIVGPGSRIVMFPLAWAFGYTKNQNKPVLPKGWKAPKK